MKKIFKNLINSIIVIILSLIFADEVRAQFMPVPLYAPPPPSLPEAFLPSSGEILSRLLPYIGGVFLVFVIAPIIGLIWYQKRGGIKKWPKIVVWILAILFVIALTALIIFICSLL